jgi:hypothetical protein
LSWPLSLGVEVRVNSYGQQATNNAIYDAKLDSLLLVPYDAGGVPISMNPGVLAHEHFHFIFQRLVMSHVRDTATQTSCAGAVAAGSGRVAAVPTMAERSRNGEIAGGASTASVDPVGKTAAAIPPRVYNSYILRGLNEGFADFYGWVYSNDNSFLAKSLPEQDDMRRLDATSGRLPSESLLRRLLVDNFHPELILPEAVRAHNAYSLGSIYARYLRHLVDDLVASGRTAADARLLVTRAVIEILPEVGQQMESVYDRDFVSPNFAVTLLLAHLPPLTEAVCASLDDVHAPEADYAKPAPCEAYSPTVASPSRGARSPVKPVPSATPAAVPTVSVSAPSPVKEKQK